MNEVYNIILTDEFVKENNLPYKGFVTEVDNDVNKVKELVEYLKEKYNIKEEDIAGVIKGGTQICIESELKDYNDIVYKNRTYY